MKIGNNAYTYTIAEWRAIVAPLDPRRYASHKLLADLVTGALAHAEARGHQTVTLWPFAEYRCVCSVIDRRIRELGL